VTRFTSLLLALGILATSALAQKETMPSSRPGQPTIPADVGETKTTASGLKYNVLKEGTPGGKHPGKYDKVKVHYSGWLTNGKLFDSSVTRGEPIEFGLNQVIGGWTEGVQLMTPGSRYKFTIPPQLGYGEQGAGADIPPNATLIFEVELLSFTEGPKVPDFPTIDEAKLTKTASGLKYQMLTEGTGAQPTTSSRVTVHYSGWLTDGTEFDSSYARGQSIDFGVTQVIKGWTEGLQLMKEGGKAILVIPPDIAYGPRGKGKIPPNSTLIFQVELLKVK
jgi:FKBP-type peptidyl-prolyl cis-trans isomerase